MSINELMICSGGCLDNQYRYEEKQICTNTCDEYHMYSDSIAKVWTDECSNHQLKDTENYLCVNKCHDYTSLHSDTKECRKHCKDSLVGNPKTMKYDVKCPDEFPYTDINVCTKDCALKKIEPKSNQCILKCPSHFYFIEDVVSKEKQCVKSSPILYIEQIKECVSVCPSPLFKHNQICIPLCPSDTFIHPTKRECLSSCLPEYVNTLKWAMHFVLSFKYVFA